MKRFEINVRHLTRVEGHGNLVVNVKDGVIEELRLEIVESPRFFEAMLEGRPAADAATIAGRICGICSVGHTTASLLATEDALGIAPDEETVLLRKLLIDGETIQSHVLHLYFLVAPDLFGVGSVIPLAESHPDIVKRALRLKRVGNQVCEIIAGRKIHPLGSIPGGFARWPEPSRIRAIQEILLAARGDLEATVELFETVEFPVLERGAEYLALKAPQEYALYTGEIASFSGPSSPVREYRTRLEETVETHSAAKHARTGGETFAVGALARYNINHAHLLPWAAGVSERLGLSPPLTNPFQNNLAQLVEILHCHEHALATCEELLRRRGYTHRPGEPSRHGRGVGASEVPRGTLYHDYEIDAQGRIASANCIIPTAQNLANIEADMRELVGTMAGGEPAEIQRRLEMLVRAYDPCISCATHILEVQFV